MTVDIYISREWVLSTVEGMTAQIAQHNGGTPSFDEMWASAGDRNKLDIWLRDAVTDLEVNLKKRAAETHAVFTMSEEGNYSLTLLLSDRWDAKLTNLLTNKIQHYFAHCVMAGWLQDYPNLAVINYTELATADMTSILGIILHRNLSATESAHITDNDQAGAGAADDGMEEHIGDNDSKGDDSEASSGAGRRTDNDTRSTADSQLAGTSRDKDNCYTCGCRGGISATETRDKDDCRHDTCHSQPWSGEGLGVMTGRHRHHHHHCPDGDITTTIIDYIHGQEHHH